MIANSIYKSGRFLIPALLVWCLVGCGVAYINSVVNATPLFSAILMILPPMVINIVLSLSGRFICRFFPATWVNFYKMLVVQTIFCSLSVGAWFVVWYTYMNLMSTIFPLIFKQNDFYHSVPLVIATVILVNVIFILIHYIVLFIEKNRIASEEILQHKLSLAEAELKALKNTIHPHFLFNSLSMLQSLIIQSPKKSIEVLSSLSEFLLYSIQFSRKTEVTMAEEIAHAKNYADIELLRRSNSFSVNWEIDTQCNEFVVIPFIIQPLVENAIKHGIGSMENGGVVSISVVKDDKKAVISVMNNVGMVIPPIRNNSGTGLDTLARRIKSVFGSEGDFLVENKGCEFIVTITVPLRRSTVVVN